VRQRRFEWMQPLHVSFIFKCFQFVTVLGFDSFGVVYRPFSDLVVSFQGFDPFNANSLNEANSVLDCISGFVLVARNALPPTVILIEPKVRSRTNGAIVAGIVTSTVEPSAADARKITVPLSYVFVEFNLGLL
jgi:hypothetical protein